MRLRTAAKITAAMIDQVEDSEYCIDSLQVHKFANRVEVNVDTCVRSRQLGQCDVSCVVAERTHFTQKNSRDT